MSFADTKAFRWVVLPAVLLLFAAFWLLLDMRILGLACLLVILGLSITLKWHRRASWLFGAWICFLIFELSPVDITFINVPGPPRFVPYVVGLPMRETMERAKRGEVVLHGCVCTGFEPKWVLVW